MVSHQSRLHTRLCLPLPGGANETRRCRRRVWTGPRRLSGLAEVVAGSTGHSRPGWHLDAAPAARSDGLIQWLWGPRMQGATGGVPGGKYTWAGWWSRGSAGRGAHTPFSQTGASFLDSPTASAVFQETADTIAELADRGWYRPGSSAG